MEKIENMSDAYKAVLPRRKGVQTAAKTNPGTSRPPRKSELLALLRIAKALLCANSVEAALRAVAEGLPGLRPDAILLISSYDSGDSCFYLDTPDGASCLELNHRMCSEVRKLVGSSTYPLPLQAFTLDNGSHVAAPFSHDVNGGYIALSWRVPPEQAAQQLALAFLPRIAELAGVRLNNLLDQLHRDEEVKEQYHAFAATQSRHMEELRVSEHEKVEARELAAQDELTGLQNRRGFLAKSEQCLLIARRQELACAVIFADVDGLKLINDHQGHAAGDALIRDAAGIFNSAFRHADVVGRVGGDEFAAFTFDNATPRAIVERIRKKIAQFNAGRKGDITMSLSIGVINCDIHSEETLAEYLVRADEEMYRYKRQRGRAPH
ncbi:diguanylate cyclase [Pseudoduganella eburnea]|uniref:diguanylate cyclase n=1 Tax=Massilia eburnea TaxID=1776165 RepID=A0A6L6QC24_9BURK|nr:GGDEF domain-containing protein [Massilia eburnea]MTW10068.1 diguanylate cyclase [Massilia eburnea]